MNSYETIAFTRHGRILEVTLNQPDKLNAVGAVLHEELSRLFVDCSNDPDSDIIVLTGAGRAFSAGGDLKEMQAMIDDPSLFEKTAREAKQMVLSLLDCEKPVIAKVNGHATGLGATIALLCDVIFAADSAKIGDPHVSVGLVAGDGGATIWPQLIGYARAREFLLTGDLMTATEAARIGLINRAVPREELDEVVRQFAEKLASGATKAIRWTKMTINIPLRQLAESMMNASIAYEALSNLTSDHQEAITALAEKRPPKFTGQ
ncbi:enoyl-CoA hydratase/isomerase family protein [Sphingosinicella rhizophila]|uniref:Enoyl-CoA hydratase-related protein n=1 Tax=Sphingosinicella rhizophila TaxID=3050082 RepID=A0ABU3Q5P6_9SPHN|nr:enoyl-CoA hydratase-related protein [Sphingosinicella sp. GR2756]MDT9598732.1 enoyl-CoA hydratase-related protein [Sphingosinicella sp. GR2756]